MSKRVDVVVIGAGLGGLSAATMLARRGLKVLLLERHNVPGGYATSFVRGRFEFEVALHELSGMGTEEKPGGLYEYLADLGVLERIDLVRLPDVYRSIFPGVDLTMPVGWGAYEQVLCDAFPGDADGIHRFLGRIREISREMQFFDKLLPKHGLDAIWHLKGLPLNSASLARYLMTTWQPVLERDVKDERARAVLSQFWGYVGLPPSKISHLYMSAVLATYVTNGACHITGGSQALSSAFVEAFEEAGGELRLCCGAESIGVGNGRVKAVITEDGDEILADYVVSNLDPVSTCRELIGAAEVPESFWRRQRPAKVGVSSFNVYLGLAQSTESLGLVNHEVFINASTDIEEHYRRFHTLQNPGVVALTSYSPALPELSPTDTSMVVLTTLMYGQPWFDVAPEAYVETKNHIAAHMLDMAEGAFPGLRAATEEIEVSTPVTNMRYGGQMHGAVYGTDQVPYNATIFRPSHQGPLEGLWFVGAFTQPGGGFEPSMISGRLAGTQIALDAHRQGRGA